MKHLAATFALLSWSAACTPNANEAASEPVPATAPAVPAPGESAPKQAGASPQQAQPGPATPPPAPSAAPDAAPTYPLRWSEQVGLTSLTDLSDEYSAARGFYGELARGEKVVMPKSCADWKRLHESGYEPSTAIEVQPDLAAKARCSALTLLMRAKPASRSFVRDLKLTPKIVSILPADVASSTSPDDEAKLTASTAQKRSLKEHDPKLKAKAGAIPGSLEIFQGDAQSYILIEPLAWGDVDGDGIDDLVVSVTNGASEGSALSARVMVLTRSEADAVLRVVESM